MMDVIFKANFEGMEDAIILSGGNMRSIGKKALELMNRRLSGGKDINDKSFVKYSKGTIHRKRKLGQDTKTVTMSDSGGLRGGLKMSNSKNTVDIIPTVHSKIGKYHQTGAAGKKREWFGISVRSKSVLTKYIQEIINKKIARWNNG